MDRRKINDYERGSEALAVLHSPLSYGDNLHYEKFADGSVKCIEDEIPFDIPGSWAWVRISSICVINPKNDLNDDTEVSFIPMPHICEGYENRHSFDIRKWSEIKTGYTHFAENDIGIAKITPCFENRKSVVFHNLKNGAGAGTTELFILRPIISVEPDYLLWIAKTDDFINGGVETFSAAVGQQRVDRDFIVNYLIPLPPVNEQKSIINKINVAFSVINTVDQNKADLANTIFYAKSKILDLAIRGQLVPQNPDDEPASVLLERIRAEKEELIKQGKLKRDKKESVIFRGEDNSYYLNNGQTTVDINDDLPFDIPDSWRWVRLKDVFIINPRNKLDDDLDVSFIPMPLIDDGYSGKHATEVRHWKEVKNGFTHFAEGDVGVAKITPCFENRKSTVFENLTNGYGAGTTELHVLRPFGNNIFVQYLLAYIKSDYFVEKGKQTFTGDVGQQRISKAYVESAYFPLPPVKEQERIVQQIGIIFEFLNMIMDALS